MAQFKKTCRECGKEITVANSRYCYCSDECRTAHRKDYQKRYHERIVSDDYLHERLNKQSREYHRQFKSKPFYCGVCGKVVEKERTNGRVFQKRFHLECILNEAVSAVAEGAGYSDNRIRRVLNRGYKMSELYDEMKKRAKEQKT